MIPYHIPVAYLEGYKALINCTRNLDWPKNPKSIFTSNAHVFDDVLFLIMTRNCLCIVCSYVWYVAMSGMCLCQVSAEVRYVPREGN